MEHPVKGSHFRNTETFTSGVLQLPRDARDHEPFLRLPRERTRPGGLCAPPAGGVRVPLVGRDGGAAQRSHQPLLGRAVRRSRRRAGRQRHDQARAQVPGEGGLARPGEHAVHGARLDRVGLPEEERVATAAAWS